ncbi:hypothetical protein FV226_13160 [Methylobacterium sp. WL12]|uniref:hypothetical protein n=1 Tax=Methylobacterium sp. WL12 TaxID=2603890 RepID=UPI0011C70A6B|nr:hypothetical protein [Methylobacterium sp. WL12]TXM72172.1 hypothetical protein FV226_13160 [Methylobacterium sp. WL12]
MIETMRHRQTIRSARNRNEWGEGGTLGRLERAKAQVEAVAYFAAPELGADAAHLRDVLLLTIEDAIVQVQQDDRFTANMAKEIRAS